jgi:hypothetical protein
MKEVKNVLVRFEMEGQGIVNFDHENQKYMFNPESGVERSSKVRNFVTPYSNVKYAKKSFSRNANGELEFSVKISSECFKHSLFRNDYVADNPAIMQNKMLMNQFMASIPGQIRGYLFTGTTQTLKRKGSISITDVLQTCNAESKIDTHTKDIDNTHPSVKTSMYAKENVGKIKYAGRGDIDLQNLQFLSCDAAYDRRAFSEDDFLMFGKMIKSNISNFTPKLGYFKLKTAATDIPEYGMEYSNEGVLFLIKEYLSRMLEVQIKRSGAYADISKVEIKLVYDMFEDTHNSTTGWIDVNRTSINNLSFNIKRCYEELDYDKSLADRISYEEEMKEAVKKDALAKAKKAEEEKKVKAKRALAKSKKN